MITCEQLAIVEEQIRLIAGNSNLPGFKFGNLGATPDGTWLKDEIVSSNIVGIPFGLNNGQLLKVWIGLQIPATFDLAVYYHLGDEVGLTLLATVSFLVGYGRTKEFSIAVPPSVPKDVQIACRVVNGSCKTIKTFLTLSGTLP